ncbi:hypothetical protein F4803DRAFT_556111 [Xylaria telfairii]|nr:hypothetical protein F4803DRAFT_556111 [Xylaria telfairii]
MHYSIQYILLLFCLGRFLGLDLVGAWSAEFFSEELGCGDAAANANSTSLAYSGPDLNDTMIPELMPCLNLGAPIGDPLVDCTAREAGHTGTGDCETQDGFVGKSVTVTNMLFCLGWEQAGCLGDVHFTWTIDTEKQEDGCHPGLVVRSFKCLQ